MNMYDLMLNLGKERMRDFHRESDAHRLANEAKRQQKRLHRVNQLIRLFNALRQRWLTRFQSTASRPHDPSDATILSE